MEIKQMEIFICAAKTLNFSKTAEALYISQPTVSACISALEKYVGAQLFVRSTKETSLTKAGRELFIYAQKILSLREQAIHSIGGGDRNIRGGLDIIASTIPAQHLLPEIIASFRVKWPNILFKVEQADSRQVQRQMTGFLYDFGMVGTIPDGDRFIHFPIYDDELVLVVPNGAPESAQTIRGDFAAYITGANFIMREAGSGTRAEIESLLSNAGVNIRDLRVCTYFSDAHSILSAVSKGMGISLVSKVAAAMYVEAGLLKMVEMDDPRFCRQIHLLRNKELWLSPVQQAFSDHVTQFYRN